MPEWIEPPTPEQPPLCGRCGTQRLSDRTAQRRGWCDMCQFGDKPVHAVAARMQDITDEREHRWVNTVTDTMFAAHPLGRENRE